MTAKLLLGKLLAEHTQQACCDAIKSYVQAGQRPPGLAVILIGNDPASQIYVNRKRALCEALGITTQSHALPNEISQADLLLLLNTLNTDDNIDGILVQLPLPSHIDTHAVIETISPQKDVDGFHPYNIGRLIQQRPTFRPCTPYGIITLLHHYDITLSGLHAVVVGASNIVGRPMALELLMAGCTVTVCHSKTRELAKHIQRADLFISAIGKRHIIQSEWIKYGAIVVDVGIHREGNNIVGDIDIASASQKASWITPVPGGVGPMTLAMLMKNTLQAYQNKIS